MGLETFSYISSLNTNNPMASDQKSQGDDHIRGIKTVLTASFPNVSGAVTVTHTDLNAVTGKATKAGDTYTGAHNFTGATITVAAPSAGSNPVTKTYADNLAFSVVLPSQTGNAGKVISTDGTNASWKLLQKDWAVVATNTAAVAGDALMVDTSAGAVTITLPASPAATDAPILICDYKGTFGTYNCTVARNGKNINGSAVDYTADLNFEMRGFVYVDSTVGWRSF